MLVPSLQDIQERYGYLPAEELQFLAWRAGVPLYRVQEVVSFFPHFRLAPPPPVEVRICDSMTCQENKGDASIFLDTRRHGP